MLMFGYHLYFFGRSMAERCEELDPPAVFTLNCLFTSRNRAAPEGEMSELP